MPLNTSPRTASRKWSSRNPFPSLQARQRQHHHRHQRPGGREDDNHPAGSRHKRPTCWPRPTNLPTPDAGFSACNVAMAPFALFSGPALALGPLDPTLTGITRTERRWDARQLRRGLKPDVSPRDGRDAGDKPHRTGGVHGQQPRHMQQANRRGGACPLSPPALFAHARIG